MEAARYGEYQPAISDGVRDMWRWRELGDRRVQSGNMPV